MLIYCEGNINVIKNNTGISLWDSNVIDLEVNIDRTKNMNMTQNNSKMFQNVYGKNTNKRNEVHNFK
jgi:hypothetical protein